MSSSILTAAVLLCTANLPTGGQTAFRVVVHPHSLELDLSNGQQRILPRVRTEGPPVLEAAIRIGEGTATSVLINARGNYQQLWMGRNGLAAMYGECRP